MRRPHRQGPPLELSPTAFRVGLGHRHLIWHGPPGIPLETLNIFPVQSRVLRLNGTDGCPIVAVAVTSPKPLS